MKRGLLALGAALVVLALAVVVAGCGGSSDTSSSGGGGSATSGGSEDTSSSSSGGGLNVGFIYVSPLPGSAWSESWDTTRKMLEKEDGAETTVVQPIEENPEVIGVLQDLVRKGNELIFATAFGYQPFVAQVAEENPDVDFVTIGPWSQKDERPANVSTVYGNLWEVRYLTGMVAAAMSKDNTLGFVSAFSIPSVVAGLNGFELGALSVNPDVKTKVVFTSNWYNPPQSTQAAETLAKSGADVIAKHEDSTGPILGAESAGVWAIGSEADTSEQNPKTYLTGSVYNWNNYAQEKYEQVEKGNFTNDEVNGDLESGLVELGPINAAVPAKVVKEVEKAESEIMSGKLVVFTGPINSNEGEEKLPKGKQWKTPEEVYENSAFLVEGVEGKLQE